MTATLTVRSVESIAEVPAEAWDACANPPGLSEDESAGERFNPFIAHAFLLALEQSRSVGGRSGWAPAHVLVEDSSGRLIAAAPTYLKAHSQGEYVFDHGWADAYQRAGGRYYPKLQVAVPFTPVTGRRLLVAPGAPARRPRSADRGVAGAARGGRRLLDPRHLPRSARRRSAPERRFRFARPASSFISSTPAIATSTIFSPRSPRASAKRSGASAATPSATTLRSSCLPEATSNPSIGTRSSHSTWIRGRANGAGRT